MRTIDGFEINTPSVLSDRAHDDKNKSPTQSRDDKHHNPPQVWDRHTSDSSL